MSSHPREPMWYCHECNAEMRPLMTPDPHCASCRGTFVEKIENLDDDPREFHTSEAILDERLGPLAMLASLNEILRDHSSPPGTDPFSRRAAASGPTHDRGGSPTRGMGLHLEFGGPSNRRTFVLGGQNIRRDTEPDARGNHPPSRLSEFLRGSNEANGRDPQDSIPGQLMAQYLLTFLGGGGVRGNRGLPPLFGALGMGEQGSDTGRWGDYVFTQEALDQIITQMMEGANSTRPVPATEEIVENLPRSVLERGDPLLEKDCAVCKEQFSIDSEDPGDKLVVTLPCKHSFHEGCILPWLKSSGTCPVCRFALIPQPDAHSAEPGSSSGGAPFANSRPSSSGNPSGAVRNPVPEESASGTGTSTTAWGNNPGTGSTTSDSNPGSHTNGGGFFSNLFGGYNRGGNTHSALQSILPSRDRRQGRGSRGGTGETGDTPRIPGGWRDSLD